VYDILYIAIAKRHAPLSHTFHRAPPGRVDGGEELTVTEAEARTKLLELDRRYLLVLDSLTVADLLHDPAARKREPEV
jgi:hypothetical protein